VTGRGATEERDEVRRPHLVTKELGVVRVAHLVKRGEGGVEELVELATSKRSACHHVRERSRERMHGRVVDDHVAIARVELEVADLDVRS